MTTTAGTDDLDRIVVAVNRMSEAGPSWGFWPVVFVGGCNLRCPYCLNSNIAAPGPGMVRMRISDVVAALDAWAEDGVMVSGGEPLDHPNIVGLVKALSRGRKVGISTNGTRPFELEGLFSECPALSYVAMDFKFSPRSGDLQRKVDLVGGDGMFPFRLLGSIGRMGTWRHLTPGTDSELRVTLYPPLVGESDVRDAAVEAHLSHSRLVLQQYRQNWGFDGKTNGVEPYPAAEVERLKAAAEEAGRGSVKVEVRWP